MASWADMVDDEDAGPMPLISLNVAPENPPSMSFAAAAAGRPVSFAAAVSGAPAPSHASGGFTFGADDSRDSVDLELDNSRDGINASIKSFGFGAAGVKGVPKSFAQAVAPGFPLRFGTVDEDEGDDDDSGSRRNVQKREASAARSGNPTADTEMHARKRTAKEMEAPSSPLAGADGSSRAAGAGAGAGAGAAASGSAAAAVTAPEAGSDDGDDDDDDGAVAEGEEDVTKAGERKSKGESKEKRPRLERSASTLEDLTPARLEKRQRQIDIGKATVGYKRYTAKVARGKRVARKAAHPVTPDKNTACSKRSWDGQVKKWRRALHTWDPPASAGSGKGASASDADMAPGSSPFARSVSTPGRIIQSFDPDAAAFPALSPQARLAPEADGGAAAAGSGAAAGAGASGAAAPSPVATSPAAASPSAPAKSAWAVGPPGTASEATTPVVTPGGFAAAVLGLGPKKPDAPTTTAGSITAAPAGSYAAALAAPTAEA